MVADIGEGGGEKKKKKKLMDKLGSISSATSPVQGWIDPPCVLRMQHSIEGSLSGRLVDEKKPTHADIHTQPLST